MKTAVDFKQSSANKISVDSKQAIGMQQSPLHSVGDYARPYSHSRTHFPSTVPIHCLEGYNPNPRGILSRSTNPEQNQACAYAGQYLEQRFMNSNIDCTQEINGINYHFPTVLSTLGQNNANGTHISLPACPTMNSKQLQVLQPIIKTTSQPVFQSSSSIPISHHDPFQPIWTNETSMNSVQPSRHTSPDCPPDVIQSRFDLTPETPEQIFTLPFLQLKNSASNNIQDQNTASFNLKQPKKLNKLEELAKRSHDSKKTLLKIDIPETLPPKSLFPSYSTPPGGIVLRQLKPADIQLPTSSDIVYFPSPLTSVQENVSQEPYRMGFCAQPTSYGYSGRSPVVINQAIQQPAPQYTIIIQPGSHEGNLIQPTIQAQITAPIIVQYQPAMQNLIVGTWYQDSNTPIYQYGTQCPPTMHPTAGLQYQDPETPIYQHGTQCPPTMHPTAGLHYQDPETPIYQLGTQCPPTTHLTADIQYQDPETSIYQYKTQFEPTMHNITATPQYQDPNPSMYQHRSHESKYLKNWPTDTLFGNPSCDGTIPPQQHYTNKIQIHSSPANIPSTSLEQNPSRPHGIDSQFYTSTDNLV